MALVLPAMALVGLVAAVSHDIRLPAGEWLAMLASMWIAILPLAFAGIAVGCLVPGDAAYGAISFLYLVLSALGGLWMPVALLPETLQKLAHALPTNRIADLGWKIAAGQPPATSSVLVLCAWAAGSALLALRAYRRADVA